MTEKDKSYKILEFLPPYSENYLSIRGDVSDSGIPIEFIKNNGEKWVYNFSNTLDKSIKIFNLGENQYFLVINSGVAYTIDKENENSIKEIACGINDFFEIERQIILIESYSIIIIENINNIEYFQNSKISDFRENQIENGVLKGVLNYNFVRSDYQIDLKNLELRINSEVDKKMIQKRKL